MICRILLLPLVLLLVACGPDAPELARADGPLLASETLNRSAGLYTLDDGRRVMLMPSARGGFAVFEAVDHGWHREDRLLRQVRQQGDQWIAEDTDANAVPFEWLGPTSSSGFRWGPASGQRSAMPAADPAFELIAVDYASDVPLSATILKPRAEAPVPGVVIVHGSGNSDRDNLWYVLLSRVMADAGFAVLLPDKRGSGRSGGDWRDAGFDALAADTIAAVELMKRQPGIDPERIGLIGVSQGGWIAPLAAQKHAGIGFVVSLSAAAVSPREQTTHEIRQEVLESGVPEMLTPLVMPWAGSRPASRLPEWWQKNGDFDPLPMWKTLEQPALLVFGMQDERDNVPVERSLALLRGLDRPACALQLLPIRDTGHALVDPSERLHPGFVGKLLPWLREATTPGGPCR